MAYSVAPTSEVKPWFDRVPYGKMEGAGFRSSPKEAFWENGEVDYYED